MSGSSDDHAGAAEAARVERRWATVSVCIICLLILMAAFAGVHELLMPQARVETVNARTLQLSGEFIESNLGSAVEPDGSVIARVLGQQYSFSPPCLEVPANTPITFRAASADVVHGFIIEGTNVNTMLVPGFVSEIKTRFTTPGTHHMPCHEYCGVGHEGMWANVKVVPKDEFMRLAATRRRVSCAP